MPIYEYECRACGETTEVIQKLSDPVLTDCPSCSAPELTKLMSAAGFRLSGGGWYETDFKKDKRRNVNVKEEAKPDAKPDAKPSGGCAAPACGSGSCTPTAA